MPEIKRLSIRHVEIMDYLMTNPQITLGMVAAHFCVTQAWLSCVIHSDAFQSMLKMKQEIAFHHSVLGIRDKMNAVANIGLDKIIERLPLETDVSSIAKITEGVLDRLGFGTKIPAVQINNTQTTQVNVLRSELEDARALIGKVERPKIGVTLDESGKLPTFALPNPHEAYMGQTDTEASVYPSDGQECSTEKRVEA